jgi:rod shape-determining protein MreB
MKKEYIKKAWNILKTVQVPFFSSFKAYFDLGTSNTRIGILKKGIVYREPTYIGYNNKSKEYMFYGQEAKTIQGKTPSFLEIIQPITNGVIADFDAEVALLKNSIETAINPYLEQFPLLKPPIYTVATIPSIATEIERKAVEEALQKSGCSQVTLLERAIATASGCGVDIFSHEPQLIIDLGGGLFEVSIISGGGIVGQKVIKNAGIHLNKLVANYIYLKNGTVLGENTCEKLKIDLLNFTDEQKTASVRGKSLETGLPKSIVIKSSDIREALITQFHHVLDATRELIEASQPEVADAIFRNGIALTGKIAGVPGIGEYFTKELKIDTYAVEHHADATMHGMMRLDKDPKILQSIASPTY